MGKNYVICNCYIQTCFDFILTNQNQESLDKLIVFVEYFHNTALGISSSDALIFFFKENTDTKM